MIRSGGAPSRSGIVSVTTMPESGEPASVSKALPEKMPWVATAYTSLAPSSITVCARGGERAAGVDDVVDDHGAALPFTSPIT